MNIDQKKITDAVIRETVDQLVAHFDDEQKIFKEVESQALKLIENKVDSQVKSVFKSGIENISFPQTNVFGEPKKQPLTLREFIDKTVKDYLYETVDYKGDQKRDSYRSDSDRPRLAYLVQKQTEQTVSKIVTDACVQIRDEIGTIMGTTVKAEIDKKLSCLKRL